MSFVHGSMRAVTPIPKVAFAPAPARCAGFFCAPRRCRAITTQRWHFPNVIKLSRSPGKVRVDLFSFMESEYACGVLQGALRVAGGGHHRILPLPGSTTWNFKQ
ncbi:MAG: hypothetical protein ACM3WS_07735 [Bacillota bacterium]